MKALAPACGRVKNLLRRARCLRAALKSCADLSRLYARKVANGLSDSYATARLRRSFARPELRGLPRLPSGQAGDAVDGFRVLAQATRLPAPALAVVALRVQYADRRQGPPGDLPGPERAFCLGPGRVDLRLPDPLRDDAFRAGLQLGAG